MYIPNIFNQLLRTINKSSTDIFTNPNIPPQILPQPTALGLLGQFI